MCWAHFHARTSGQSRIFGNFITRAALSTRGAQKQIHVPPRQSPAGPLGQPADRHGRSGPQFAGEMELPGVTPAPNPERIFSHYTREQGFAHQALTFSLCGLAQLVATSGQRVAPRTWAGQ